METEGTTSESREGQDQEAPACSAEKTEDEEIEGWPKSWIMITAVLGIVAIIVVARLAGRSWKEAPSGDPAAAPIMTPQPSMEANKTLLDLTHIQLPFDRICLDTEGRTHKVTGDEPPKACRLPTEGAVLFRLEIGHIEPARELPVWILRMEKEAPPLLSVILTPDPQPRPTSIASNMRMGPAVAVVLQNVGRSPLRLSRLRFLVAR